MTKYKMLKVVCDACCHIPNAHLPNQSRLGKAAGGYFFIDELGNIISEHGVYLGEYTVPQAEYHTLICALDKASEYCRGKLEVWMDSELVIRQMTGVYGIKSENMKPLFHEVKKLEQRFDEIKYFHHRREASLAKKADTLANSTYNKYQIEL